MGSGFLEESQSAVIAVEELPADQRQARPRNANPRPKQEPNYHVILWNDDDHTPEYVIQMLTVIFSHRFEKAVQITRDVHNRGKAITCTCHKELAELRREQIMGFGGDPELPEGPQKSMHATIEPVRE